MADSKRYFVTSRAKRFYDPLTSLEVDVPAGTTLALDDVSYDGHQHCVLMLAIVRTYHSRDNSLVGRVVCLHWVDGGPEPWTDPPEGLDPVEPVE